MLMSRSRSSTSGLEEEIGDRNLPQRYHTDSMKLGVNHSAYAWPVIVGVTLIYRLGPTIQLQGQTEHTMNEDLLSTC